MGVIIQTFYWNCPALEGREHEWWKYLAEKVPSLREAGFTALWLPPASKGANLGGMSMGYDPYDYYDLGDIDQKGGVETWFGSRSDLEGLIGIAHDHGLQVYADLVLNHNNGGDEEEETPLGKRWTRFDPKSGKFLRDWECFHPSPYEAWDRETFGGMPDLCHRNPRVYTELLEYARWLLEEIGFDGFRYDCVKGYGGWMVRAIQELRCLRAGEVCRPYGVGECWDSDRVIHDWLDEANSWSDNPVGAFDFPLRYRLKDLCEQRDYSLRRLVEPGTLLQDRASCAVTFVENHDLVREDAIASDTMPAYAFILTHEGYPCVFWYDYYNLGMAGEGTPSGIAALVDAHERYAAGATSLLHLDDELYIMQRSGDEEKPGLIFVMNTRDHWNGASVQTGWNETLFAPVAWRGKENLDRPDEKLTGSDGVGDFWAPPRGYAIYAPKE